MSSVNGVPGSGGVQQSGSFGGTTVPSFGDIKMDRPSVLPTFNDDIKVPEGPKPASVSLTPATPTLVSISDPKPVTKPLSKTNFAITSGPPQGDP